MIRTTVAIGIGSFSLFSASAENRIEDASFEAPVTPLFELADRESAWIGKVAATDAPDGKKVLEVRSWGKAGAIVVSRPMEVKAGEQVWKIDLRAIGGKEPLSVEIQVLAADDSRVLASSGLFQSGDGWKAHRGTVSLPTGKVRLAVKVAGGEAGLTALQLDRAGWFSAEEETEVSDNAQWELMSATAFANGSSWSVREHFEHWYRGIPYERKMLSGSDSIKREPENPVARVQMHARHSGRYTLWLRYLSSGKNPGEATLEIKQNGRQVALHEIDTGAANSRNYEWTWLPIPLELEVGEVELELTRPPGAASRLARNFDALILSNLTDREPQISDITPRVYVRWTNSGEGEAYGLWTFIHRNIAPWFAYGGILSKAGFNERHRMPRDPSQWVGAGEQTPWCDLSPYLRPEGNYNRLQFIATRQSNSAGLVQGPIRGKLEFAVGTPERVVKVVEINQHAPRLVLTVPGDFAQEGAEIRTAEDFLKPASEVMAPFSKDATRVRHLDLSAALDLRVDLDPKSVIDEEIAQLHRLGFNALTNLREGIAAFGGSEQARAWLKEHDVKQASIWSGSLYQVHDKDQTRPDHAAIEERFAKLAKEYEGVHDFIARVSLADEPAGPSYKALKASPTAQVGFRTYLEAQGLMPSTFGASDWSDIHPIAYEERHQSPLLFYHTGRYRLDVAADLTRTAVAAKKRHLPSNVKTFVNYSPQLSWVDWGVDPFLLQRRDGLEMGWSEDWMGYHVSPQFISDTYAILRAAGEGQPIGGYMVAASGGVELQRLKYYATVAGGAREIAVFKYGPAYIAVDSWSENLEVYPEIARLNREMAVIDEALHETKRQQSDVAMLYNRTAAIWSGPDVTTELDARFMRWALSHEGYDADIIPEEDIEAGKLSQYKALYLSGIQIREATAQKIAEWVKGGGVLLGTAGAGSRDEYDRPNDLLNAVFGINSSDLTVVQDAGRPRHELPNRRHLNMISVNASGLPSAKFSQLCYQEWIVPKPSATVIASDTEGRPSGVIHQYGAGSALRLSLLPGLAYLNRAITAPGARTESYQLSKYDPQQRQFLAWAADLAKCRKVAESKMNAGEIVRYDGEERSLFFVINHAGEAQENFAMTIPNAKWATRGYTAGGRPVTITPLANGFIRVSASVQSADAIVIER